MLGFFVVTLSAVVLGQDAPPPLPPDMPVLEVVVRTGRPNGGAQRLGGGQRDRAVRKLHHCARLLGGRLEHAAGRADRHGLAREG